MPRRSVAAQGLGVGSNRDQQAVPGCSAACGTATTLKAIDHCEDIEVAWHRQHVLGHAAWVGLQSTLRCTLSQRSIICRP